MAQYGRCYGDHRLAQCGDGVSALQLVLSDTVPLQVALTSMLAWHIMIGIGEGLITLVAVSYVWRTRPDLLYDPPLAGSQKVSSQY